MEPRKKRNSILKVRQAVETIEETVMNSGPSSTTTNRRVSFHNVKHVKQYDRDHGKILDATPVKEKITDTIGSDGILTPRGGNMDISESPACTSSFQVFGGGNLDKTMDMSLETTINENNETARLFETTRDPTLLYEKIVETTTKVTERIVSMPLDDTLAMFNTTNQEDKDMSVDRSVLFTIPKVPKHNATMNRTIPMDLDESKAAGGQCDETMNVFNFTNLEAAEMDTSKLDENNTMNAIRIPINSNVMPVDMDITEHHTLIEEKKNDTFGPSQLMDISAPQVQVNDTLAIFNSPRDICNKGLGVPQNLINIASNVVPVDMDITDQAVLNAEKKNDQFETSQLMDISIPKVLVNDTMAMFNSPKHVSKSSMDLEKTIEAADKSTKYPSIADEVEDLDMDMDITEQQPCEAGNQQNDGLQLQKEDLMDISVIRDSPAVNDTMAVFQSPARVKIGANNSIIDSQKSIVFGDEMSIDETQNDGTLTLPKSNVEVTTTNDVYTSLERQEENASENVSMINESSVHSEIDKKSFMLIEEERAFMHSSMIDVAQKLEDDGSSKTPVILASQSASLATKEPSALHNSSATLNNSMELDNNTLLKTMQITTCEDISMVHESIAVELNSNKEQEQFGDETLQKNDTSNTGANFTFQGHNETSQIMNNVDSEAVNTSKISTYSAFNLSINQSISKRRRSLLNSARESPRRVALENSIMSMNGQTMEALTEYRQNKTMQTSQDSMPSMSLNDSGRDILAMNTSVRSPHLNSSKTAAPGTPSLMSQNVQLPPPSPQFEMPDFDPAVVNVVYLTSEDPSTEQHPEALKFQRIVENEKMKVQHEIDSLNSTNQLSAEKIDMLKTKELLKFSHDEREAIMIARKDAEIKFLELRLKFALEKKIESDQEIAELEQGNSKMAEQLRGLDKMAVVQKELEKLRSLPPSREESGKIRKEWMEMKQWEFDQKMKALRNVRSNMIALRSEKNALEMKVAEEHEKFAQRNDLKKSRMLVFSKAVKKIVNF